MSTNEKYSGTYSYPFSIEKPVLDLFDTAIAAKAMDLPEPPKVVSFDWGIAEAHADTNEVWVNPLFIKGGTDYLPRLYKALQWNTRREHTTLVRWMIAHEMGHLVQAMRFDSVSKFLAEYHTSLCHLEWDDSKVEEYDKAYRETLFEAEADEFANKHWQKVKIK